MRITWWEYEELLEHLESRPDLWTPSPSKPNTWARCSSDQIEMLLGFSEPAKPGPYRMYGIGAIPVNWTPSESEKYLSELVSGWTSYSIRLSIVNLLETELGIPQDKAFVAAIAIARMFVDPTPHDPDASETPLQAELYEDPKDVYGDSLIPCRREYLMKGGHLSLEPVGGQLRIKIIMPTLMRSGLMLALGYGYELRGFVHPVRGSIEQAKELLIDGRQETQ